MSGVRCSVQRNVPDHFTRGFLPTKIIADVDMYSVLDTAESRQ